MIFFIILQFAINTFIIISFDKISKLINLFDFPNNKRKLHKKKVALLGGSLFFLNILIFKFYNFLYLNVSDSSNFSSIYEVFLFLICSFFFYLLGFLDDKFNLSANLKLFFKFFLILILLSLNNDILIKELNFSFLSNKINIDYISYFFSILCFLLFINAFNMFDGINLQASIYSIFLFLVFIVKGVFIEISIILIIALLFFSYLNFKSKCFMGDNGTLLISFIISYFFVKSATTHNAFSADEIFLIMLIPGLDLARLAVTRLLSRTHPFKGDTNHIHHILLRSLGIYKTLSLLFLLIFIPNIISLIYGGTLYLIIISIFIYFFLATFFNFRNNKKIKII